MSSPLAVVAALCLLSGCAASASTKAAAAPATKTPRRPPATATQGDDSASAQSAPPSTAAEAPPEGGQAALDVSPLPEKVDGGEIQRSALFAVLQEGVGRFLRRVDVEPHLERGRFVGWRLNRIFTADGELQSNVVQPGDTVLRVNGQSIERPEQFKNVWDSMATSSELVLLVRRSGQQSTVRYRIVE